MNPCFIWPGFARICFLPLVTYVGNRCNLAPLASLEFHIMAKIENLDFLKEILKSQPKVRKHTPNNVANSLI